MYISSLGNDGVVHGGPTCRLQKKLTVAMGDKNFTRDFVLSRQCLVTLLFKIFYRKQEFGMQIKSCYEVLSNYY